jgi:copper chaperone CopZ
MITTTFTTPDLSCGGCAAGIKASLSREPGVLAVHVTVPAKRVEIAFDPAATSRERLAAALSGAGYPPRELPEPVVVPAHRLDALSL